MPHMLCVQTSLAVMCVHALLDIQEMDLHVVRSYIVCNEF